LFLRPTADGHATLHRRVCVGWGSMRRKASGGGVLPTSNFDVEADDFGGSYDGGKKQRKKQDSRMSLLLIGVFVVLMLVITLTIRLSHGPVKEEARPAKENPYGSKRHAEVHARRQAAKEARKRREAEDDKKEEKKTTTKTATSKPLDAARREELERQMEQRKDEEQADRERRLQEDRDHREARQRREEEIDERRREEQREQRRRQDELERQKREEELEAKRREEQRQRDERVEKQRRETERRKREYEARRRLEDEARALEDDDGGGPSEDRGDNWKNARQAPEAPPEQGRRSGRDEEAEPPPEEERRQPRGGRRREYDDEYESPPSPPSRGGASGGKRDKYDDEERRWEEEEATRRRSPGKRYRDDEPESEDPLDPLDDRFSPEEPRARRRRPEEEEEAHPAHPYDDEEAGAPRGRSSEDPEEEEARRRSRLEAARVARDEEARRLREKYEEEERERERRYHHEEEELDESRYPRAELPEERETGPLLSVTEEHHHVLAYYVRALKEGTLKPFEGATVLHVDSHADLGVPSAYFGEDGRMLDVREAKNSRALEDYAEINDFLLLGAHLGLIDHVVFVEPPWSNQFRCCVYRTNQTFEFAVGLDEEKQLKVDVVGETAKQFDRERFGHVFWRNGDRRVAAMQSLADVRLFKVTTVAQEHADLGAVLRAVVDPKKPLIVDVDLDAFATVSPGAIATKARFQLTDDQLETLYHLVWNFPPLGVDYLVKKDPGARDRAGADKFAEKARAYVAEKAGGDKKKNTQKTANLHDEEDDEPPFGSKNGGYESRLATAFATILDRRDVTDAKRRETILDYAAAVDNSHASQRLRPLDPRSHANLEAFLEQPLHVPADLGYELDFVLEHTWKPALTGALQTPFLISLVRSPGYVPDDRLSLVECRVLDFFSDIYNITHLHHEDRVDVRRTDCASATKWYGAGAAGRNKKMYHPLISLLSRHE